MKKSVKIIIGIVVVFLLTIVIDLICIFTINRPIFVISEDYGNYAIYKGIFFDTYSCPEYSIPQIKGKGIKFNCANIKLEEVKNALKRGIIKISDLDKYSINYIKYEKEVNNDRD